jgi:hypothetical protein
MRPRDTSAAAAAIQDEAHTRLGPAGRFRLAMQMSELAHEFAKAGVRQAHPEYTEQQVMRELVRILYGR